MAVISIGQFIAPIRAVDIDLLIRDSCRAAAPVESEFAIHVGVGAD